MMALPPARRFGRTLWIIGATAILVAGGLVWGYEEVLEEHYLTTRWGEVEPGLIYRSGDLPPMRAEQVLGEADIQLVCKLSLHVPEQLHHRREAEAVADLGIRMRTFPMAGNGTGDVQSYVNAVTAIHRSVQRGEPVLVHCAAGTNRTGGVIAVYRLLVQGRDVEAVYAEMRRYDFDPHDNRELLPHLNAYLPAIARGLVQRDVIDRMPDPLLLLAPAAAAPGLGRPALPVIKDPLPSGPR